MFNEKNLANYAAEQREFQPSKKIPTSSKPCSEYCKKCHERMKRFFRRPPHMNLGREYAATLEEINIFKQNHQLLGFSCDGCTVLDAPQKGIMQNHE